MGEIEKERQRERKLVGNKRWWGEGQRGIREIEGQELEGRGRGMHE